MVGVVCEFLACLFVFVALLLLVVARYGGGSSVGRYRRLVPGGSMGSTARPRCYQRPGIADLLLSTPWWCEALRCDTCRGVSVRRLCAIGQLQIIAVVETSTGETYEVESPGDGILEPSVAVRIALDGRLCTLSLYRYRSACAHCCF
jgi:hypothetical protein